MTTAYSSLLGLALPVQGELSGTWGDMVDNGITQYLDIAVAGTQSITGDSNVTLSLTNGTSSATNLAQVGSGTTGSAQYAIISCTGARTALRTITVPAQSKIYTVINATTGGFSIKVVGAGPTAGLTIIPGESAQIAWNGSDFIKISSNTSLGALTVTSLTDSGLTSGRVTYATTGGLLTDSANLQFSGTDLTVYGLTVGRGAGAVASNTAVGSNALANNVTGSDSTAVGKSALRYATSVNNTAFGSLALGNAVVSGSENTAIGRASLFSHTTGNNNSALGSLALFSNTTGGANTALGEEALQANTTGTNNTAVGYQAGYSNTTGGVFDAFGTQALYSHTTGYANAAFGYGSSYSVTTGNGNSSFGRDSLRGTTTGSQNTAIGRDALLSNTTASNNTAVGYQALYSNTTIGFNTSLGYQSGYSLNGGSYNTFIGPYAGYYVTTGSKNTVIGNYGGNQGGLDIRTASNYIVLSDGDGNPRGIFDSSGNLGLGVTPNTWSLGKAVEIGVTGAGFLGYGNQLTASKNAYYNGGWKYARTGDNALQFDMSGGQFAWYNAPSGTAGNAITFTQAMTLDASGRLLVGVTSSGNAGFIEANGTIISRGQSINTFAFDQAGIDFNATTKEGRFFATSSNGTGGYIAFYTGQAGGSEKARIDSSGNLLVGTTSATAYQNNNSFVNNVAGGYSIVNHISGTASGAAYIGFGYNGGAIGSITQSGTTAVLFNVTSDQRLKENIVNAPEFGSVIDSIKVRSYDWITDQTHQRAGFIAQELVTVAPEAVHQPADPEEMMAVDYSKLVPMLVKEIQSLRKRLADAGIA